jgi:D-glycero-alpha-D-manno-heptose-7-phosphate kinase
MVVTKTPLRISFFGGGTDIEYFYKKFGGDVFSTTINKYIYVTVKQHGEIFRQTYRLNYSESERKKKLSKIKNDIIRECLKVVKINRPVYISTVGDVPNSSGLGSSSSFTVGLLKALYEFESRKINKKDLAELACKIEINILKNYIGKQDQYAAAYGGLNHISFKKNSKIAVNKKNSYISFLKFLFKNSILLYTGVTRNASNILKSQKKKESIEKLKIIKKLCNEFLVIKKSNLTLKNFSKFLDDSWKIKSNLSNKTSNKKIDKIFALSRKYGAQGQKLLGAGGGGFFFLIIKEKEKKLFLKNLSKYQFLDLKYEPNGSRTIYQE